MFRSIITNFSKGNIQQNLEDQFVQEALNKGLDLRKYSKEVDQNLRVLEKNSIQDCNLQNFFILLMIFFNFLKNRFQRG